MHKATRSPENATQAWAKLGVDTALPLLDHSGDVASVLTELLVNSHWRNRLKAAAGRTLQPSDVARLGTLACLHDLGKANAGFWRRQFEGNPRVGHTNETAALFSSALLATAPSRLLCAILAEWDADELFRAVMAHHGRPLEPYWDTCDLDHVTRPDLRHWRAADGYDPLAELDTLLAMVRQRFPLAFTPAPPLPSAPEFIALVCGLVTLADWLGSDVRLFPVGPPHGDAREDLRDTAAAQAVAGRGLGERASAPAVFGQAFRDENGPMEARGAQIEAGRLNLGPVALIEAETGSGKTEAALWRWLVLRQEGLVDGLYFALPTRSAAVQLHGRVQRVLDRVFGPGEVEAVLAVPGYLRAGDAEGQRLPEFAVQWSDGGETDARWAAETARRFLAARVAVGTVDQVLMAGLKLRHAHFRAAMLARSLLVVDEVHASDSFMGEVLRAVLRNHVAFGGHALLLSATLGAGARAALLDLSADTPVPPLAEAEAVPYPAMAGSRRPPAKVSGAGLRDKPVGLELLPAINDPAAVAARAVAAARDGASVLVVRNSVAGAVAVARAVETAEPGLAFRVNGVATLHHGRFAPGDRRLLDAAVERGFGKGRSATGRVLVGTQTLEQSLDIDADLLITDLAPMDVLLQRIGRLHRHVRDDRGAYAEARCLVLVPPERDLSRYLNRVQDRHGLGPMRSGEGVYPDLLGIEGTLRQLEANSAIAIPADNRRLIERALHPEVAAALKAELGAGWTRHADQQDGKAIYERGFARDLALDASKPFSSLRFPEVGEEVSTRLGLRDRCVDFDPLFVGPFESSVARLIVPGWMIGKTNIHAVAENVRQSAGTTFFDLGDHAFVYDRFGVSNVV